VLVEDIQGWGGLAVQCCLDQSHPGHPRSVVALVDDDNDLSFLISGDPDDHS